MKKHNKLFYISITGLLLVVVGTCMIGAGISAGGSKTFLSVNESTASWWPFSASVGFGNGERDDKEIFHGSVKKSFTPKNIIELHVAVGDIEIRKGNENICALYNIADDKFEMKEEDGKLIIKVLSSIGNNKNQKLVLQLKEPTQVKVVSASVETGDVDISNMELEEIYAKSNVGDVTLKNVQAKAGSITSETGDIETVNTIFDMVEIGSQVGDIDYDGDIKGNSSINTEVGDINVSLMRGKEEYGFTVVSSLGDIEIDDEKYAYGETSLNANTKQNIQINCSTGSVEINFR